MKKGNIEKGKLIVVSGPAGSGKGTVLSLLRRDEKYTISVSATTRAPRPGEVDGVNYYFLTREQFEERIAQGDMLEHAEYCGNFYGTPKRAADEVLQSGRHLLLEIEVAGAAQIKAKYPEALLIMLLPPSFAVQEARLRSRGTETEDKILKRLATTREELTHLDEYDFVVFNYDGMAEQTAEDIRDIVRGDTAEVLGNKEKATHYFD